MEKLKLTIQLTRLNKPIGIMLLFWPCVWGLTLAYSSNLEKDLYYYYLLLFFLGSILMRSAGCIVNDIVDKDFDIRVKRTKKRPIASGKLSIFSALSYIIALCLIALIILLQFNLLTICLGLGSMFLAFSYPFMKRLTYWPQLFLGLTFNWGIIMGWSSIANNISVEAIILYFSAIFWTLGYDTIYGLQDIHDDEIIGVKSTSIKFKNNVKTFVGICYGLSIFFVLLLFFKMNINNYFLPLIVLLIVTASLIYQLKIFKINKPESCLKAFKTNNLTGFIISILIFSFSWS